MAEITTKAQVAKGGAATATTAEYLRELVVGGTMLLAGVGGCAEGDTKQAAKAPVGGAAVVPADITLNFPRLQAVVQSSDTIQPFQSRVERIRGALVHEDVTLETMIVGSGGRGEEEREAHREMMDTENYRIATHDENWLNAKNLLERDKEGLLAPEEVKALEVYRSRRVDDAEGYVEIRNDKLHRKWEIERVWRRPGEGYTSVLGNRSHLHYPGEIDALMVRTTPESQIRPETQTLKTVEGTLNSGGLRLGTMLADLNTDTSSAEAEHRELMDRMNFRTATRWENYDNAKGLLSREKKGTLTAEDTQALEIYRSRPVEDAEGSVTVHGDRIVEYKAFPVLDHDGLPRDIWFHGQYYPDTHVALVVRTIAVESE